MIVSFRDEWLRAFFVEDMRSRSIPSDLESRLFRKLQMIDDATTDQDLRVLPSNHFEKLRGGISLDRRQQSVAARLPVGRQPWRGGGRLSRRP
jgi:plasmid maintenance system killer protein